MPDSFRKRYFSKPLKRLSSIGIPEVKAWCLRRVPILEWAPKYNYQECLIPDCISGVIMAFYQLTHALGFAAMASVNPKFGLYGSFFPALIYAIFGMGRHTVTGTFAIPSLIAASAVERLVPPINFTTINGSVDEMEVSDFEMRRVGVAAAVTFLGGAIQVTLSFLQLGCLTFLLTEPVVSAITTGAATQVATSVIKYLIKMEVPHQSGPLWMFKIFVYIFKHISTIHVASLIMSLLSIGVLVLTKELNEKYKNKIKIFIPIDIIVLFVASIVCYFANLEEDHGFNVIGHIPTGIPAPQPPPMDAVPNVVVEGVALAFVGYAVSVFLAFNSSKKFKYSISENQELFAHGLSNLIPSFFYCIPNAGAPARTLILYATGSRTQVTCLLSCILMLLVIYFATSLLYWVPMCVLGSVIIVGLKGMLSQFRDLRKYWNVDKYDWLIWICTYVISVCFFANLGLLFGVVFSIAVQMFRLFRTKAFELHEDFSPVNEVNIEDLKVISIATPLYFINAEKFCKDLFKQINKLETRKRNPRILLTPISNGSKKGARSHKEEYGMIFLLNCRRVSFFDFTGVSTLAQVCRNLQELGADVLLSGCTESLRKSLFLCNCEVEKQNFFNSVDSALEAIKKTRGSSLEAIHLNDL